MLARAQRADSRDRQRRDLNAQLAGELLTAQQKLQIGDRRVGRAMRGRRSAASARSAAISTGRWPARSASGSGVRRPAPRLSQRHRNRRRRGPPRPRSPRRHRRVCGHLRRLRQPRHRRSRRQTFSLYGNLQDIAVERGTPASQRGRTIGSVGVSARPARPGSTSSFASTVSPSIPYNG